MTPNEQFLVDMRDAAKAAGHIWPEFAACEAAVESSWGSSEIYKQAWNIFGQKAPANLPAGQKTLVVPTKEFINNNWVTQNATWLAFDSAATCFTARMALLRRLPIYSFAMAAKTGQDYVQQVSASWLLWTKPNDPTKPIYTFGGKLYLYLGGRWGTAPARAHTVLEIYNAHSAVFAPPPVVATPAAPAPITGS